MPRWTRVVAALLALVWAVPILAPWMPLGAAGRFATVSAGGHHASPLDTHTEVASAEDEQASDGESELGGNEDSPAEGGVGLGLLRTSPLSWPPRAVQLAMVQPVSLRPRNFQEEPDTPPPRIEQSPL